MAEIMKLYNSYLGPAVDGGINMGETTGQWAEFFVKNNITTANLIVTSNLTVLNSVSIGSNGFGKLVTVFYEATTNQAISNTETETIMIGSGIGTRTIPTSYLSPGKTLRLTALGTYSTQTTAPTV